MYEQVGEPLLELGWAWSGEGAQAMGGFSVGDQQEAQGLRQTQGRAGGEGVAF